MSVGIFLILILIIFYSIMYYEKSIKSKKRQIADNQLEKSKAAVEEQDTNIMDDSYFYPQGYLEKENQLSDGEDYIKQFNLKSRLVVKGCAIGDAAGRTHESISPTFCREEVNASNLYDEATDCTDDTILTCATLESILVAKDSSYPFFYKNYASKWPMGGYGYRFINWVNGGVNQESCGNGAAMRVSPCGCFKKVEDVVKYARKSAECTHSHPEGIKGAIVTAVCIWMAFNGYTKREIGEYCHNYYPDSKYSPLISYNKIYSYKNVIGNPALCQVTVPMTVNCFVHSEDFDDCILKAIHMGWDTDTQAAIAGTIAAAYYGNDTFSCKSNEVWENLKNLPYIVQAFSFLDLHMDKLQQNN